MPTEPKFVHYRPRTLIINNIEFDHANIFLDLEAIKRQFHRLVRTVPGSGRIIRAKPEPVIDEVLAMGYWTAQESFGDAEDALWRARPIVPNYSHFEVRLNGQRMGEVQWPLIGHHNANNALAAIAAQGTGRGRSSSRL
jgi:UDP-N-acetylmuramate: L-alanyl-gamma-D-glutamyl-meso-diaminopimelate ligase